MNIEKEIARILLEIDAVKLSADPPFTWASGRLSPIYCDNRLIMSHPKYRKTVAEGFAALFEEKGYRPDVIAGTATAGIPHAAWLADLLMLPMIYIRGRAKDHGRKNRVEGALKEGQSVVLIEDLISTGGSSVEAARGVTEAGGRLLGVTAIFTYELDTAKQQFRENKIEMSTLTRFSALLAEAQEMNKLNPDDLSVLAKWRQDPVAWSDARKAG
jgi:orotate phosphoribosyltransferase